MTQNFQELPTGFEDFHPTNVPKGMKDYAIKVEITPEQQNQLNYHKLNVLRENHQYIKSHPEIKNVVNLLLKEVLRRRPSTDIDLFMVNYFFQNLNEFSKIIYGSDFTSKKSKQPTDIASEYCISVSSLRHYNPERYGDSLTSSDSSGIVVLEQAGKNKAIDLQSQAKSLNTSKIICESILNDLVDNFSTNELS
ncbi:uncharacterized protein LOC130903406 [Diorhabda carinulata]|uniref:uncharacterized protein LOC130903406 n=1 Tax=Diorhabda carinulata TaxID=1163345 RepID=UPI0025A08FED|nr:uncharacterized protein LOC130903406 [Diorhabda carinulata]